MSKFNLPKIIPDWRDSWRYLSVWAWGIVIGLPELYALLLASPYAEQLGATAMPALVEKMIVTIGIAGLLGRYIDQKRPEGPAPWDK